MYRRSPPGGRGLWLGLCISSSSSSISSVSSSSINMSVSNSINISTSRSINKNVTVPASMSKVSTNTYVLTLMYEHLVHIT
jgi:hypothetical protein